MTAASEAFWRFSLALYARPGVADALIGLQDRAGRDVNLLLYALWLGVRGVRLDTPALAAATAAIGPIDTGVVAPLRRLRRKLRGTGDPQLAGLRRRILGLELAGERSVQNCLEALPAPVDPGLAAGGVDLAGANLALSLGGAHREAESVVLLDALRRLTHR